MKSATAPQEVSSTPGSQYYEIGRGNCGSIWALPFEAYSTSYMAYKLKDGASDRSLANDFAMHGKVLQALSAKTHRLSIPARYQLIESDDEQFWQTEKAKFPRLMALDRTCQCLIMERIPPIPRHVRQLLVEKYCPENIKASVLRSPKGEDCLWRPYFGRLVRPESRFFTLRNHAVPLAQLLDLGVDAEHVLYTMAVALAYMHWGARIDANDVEFVLAPPRPTNVENAGPPMTFRCEALGELNLWLLDFDCCKNMPMTPAGVAQAVEAFFRNDPYYPRPKFGEAKEQQNAWWDNFRKVYLEVSVMLLQQEKELLDLPCLFVKQVEERVIDKEKIVTLATKGKESQEG
ncbi:zinc finger protein-domain-containing protein [Lophiotrema nucula]|uniref:Zinc finger protein-domain-containing protein n=1 Tax=Lophiotrema nucula TaxID=690887 RepID=A0A6A5ZRK6_9PLEO|nr:zinc finger protein-domain-containing protein [Lophiotrema nucula]